MKLVSNLYAYVWEGSDNNCNSYVFANVIKGNKHLVIDPGHIVTPYYHEPGLARLREAMEEDGIASENIGLVILTHGHGDHCEAAKIIREQNHALVAINKLDENAYRRAGGIADLYLEEGNLELANINQIQLQIYHSPGHSEGHITIYWPEEKVLIAGDVIFYQSTGRTDFPGGSEKVLKQSIDRLSRLDIEYLLCGHPYDHPGIIKGRAAVKQNFEFINKYIFS